MARRVRRVLEGILVVVGGEVVENVVVEVGKDRVAEWQVVQGMEARRKTSVNEVSVCKQGMKRRKEGA